MYDSYIFDLGIINLVDIYLTYQVGSLLTCGGGQSPQKGIVNFCSSLVLRLYLAWSVIMRSDVSRHVRKKKEKNENETQKALGLDLPALS